MNRNEDQQFISLDSEKKGKKYIERIALIEKRQSSLGSVFTGYTAKSAQLRDKNDEISKCLYKFSEEEPFETATKASMQLLSQILDVAGKYRDVAVVKLEEKVLSSLISYEDTFKHLRADIRKVVAVNRKEAERKKDLEKFLAKGDKSKYHNAIVLAKNSLEKVVNESSLLNTQVQTAVQQFEEKQLVDMKKNMKSFLKTEISMCSKLIELFTEAYQIVRNIDIENDLSITRSHLEPGFKSEKRQRQAKLNSSGSILRTANKEIGRTSSRRRAPKTTTRKFLNKMNETASEINKRIQKRRASTFPANDRKEQNVSNKKGLCESFTNRTNLRSTSELENICPDIDINSNTSSPKGNHGNHVNKFQHNHNISKRSRSPVLDTGCKSRRISEKEIAAHLDREDQDMNDSAVLDENDHYLQEVLLELLQNQSRRNKNAKYDDEQEKKQATFGKGESERDSSNTRDRNFQMILSPARMKNKPRQP